ncbi:hypothetical protein BJV74DRAFT_270274 [Russula compacta]|nr:hypothetical protein BJV74DRAFT_270274 [Russula compacta]
MDKNGTQRIRSCLLRGRIEVIRRRGRKRKRKTPGPGALVQGYVNGASKGKDAHRVRQHYRIPSQAPRRGHQLVPKLAKHALDFVAGILDLRLAHRARRVVDRRSLDEPNLALGRFARGCGCRMVLRVGQGVIATTSTRVEQCQTNDRPMYGLRVG